jgi:hypothetical protein
MASPAPPFEDRQPRHKRTRLDRHKFFLALPFPFPYVTLPLQSHLFNPADHNLGLRTESPPRHQYLITSLPSFSTEDASHRRMRLFPYPPKAVHLWTASPQTAPPVRPPQGRARLASSSVIPIRSSCARAHGLSRPATRPNPPPPNDALHAVDPQPHQRDAQMRRSQLVP